MSVAKRRPALVGSRQHERDKLDACLMLIREQILAMDDCHHPRHHLTTEERAFARSVVSLACEVLMPREEDTEDNG